MQQPRCIGPSYRQETLPAAVPFLQHGVVFPDQIENVLARLVIGRETVLGPAAGREVPYQRQLDAAVEKSVVIGPIGLLDTLFSERAVPIATAICSDNVTLPRSANSRPAS